MSTGYAWTVGQHREKNILSQTRTDICRRGRHVESLEPNLVTSLVGDVTYITRHEAGNLSVFSLRFFTYVLKAPKCQLEVMQF